MGTRRRFASMSGYSNHNVSYETVGLSDEGRGKVVHHQPNKGLHPSIVERFLKRRVYFRRLLKELPKDSRESECSRGITMGEEEGNGDGMKKYRNRE